MDGRPASRPIWYEHFLRHPHSRTHAGAHACDPALGRHGHEHDGSNRSVPWLVCGIQAKQLRRFRGDDTQSIGFGLAQFLAGHPFDIVVCRAVAMGECRRISRLVYG